MIRKLIRLLQRWTNRLIDWEEHKKFISDRYVGKRPEGGKPLRNPTWRAF